MSFYPQARSLPNRFCLALRSFLQRPGLPFADALPEAAIEKAFDEADASFAEEEDAVYTPPVTLWAFLSQVLFKDEQRSCIAAVARVSMLLIALERGPCSTNTGAYCRARGKLSETVLRRLTIKAADACDAALDDFWLWHGRHIQLVDGTTVSMPDTPENQKAYPQARTQKAGLGFPVARVVVRLSFATGMLRDMGMGPYLGKETGETALLRSLLGGGEARRHSSGRSLLLESPAFYGPDVTRQVGFPRFWIGLSDGAGISRGLRSWWRLRENLVVCFP